MKEADLITEFTESGCECTTQCSKLFSRSHYECMRNQCAELSKENLDMVIFGQIMALLPLLSCSDDMKMSKYMHRGHKVKLITELKIFGTQMFLCLYRSVNQLSYSCMGLAKSDCRPSNRASK